MQYVLIPLEYIEGLTVGKQYEVSDYTFNCGEHAVINDDGKIFTFGLQDKRIKIIPKDNESNICISEKEFDEMIDELIELCFEIESGEYYCDRCLEFDSVLEVLNKHINQKEM